MAKECREFTAFSTPTGHYQYNVMPQGVKGAASFFAKIVSEVFKHLMDKAFTVYQDDVANHESRNITEHLKLQQEIYDALGERSMCLKPTKTFMNYAAQRILGHILDKRGRRPDPKTLEAISKMKEKLTTIGEVRSLMGLATVVREYIPSMAVLMAPIQALLQKGVDIEAVWEDKVHGEAFRALKQALCQEPILLIFDEQKPIVVVIDACRVGRGLGAVLMQNNDDMVLHPCFYWSRGLTTAERKYSATELECTALHDALLHWRVYLHNGKVTAVITDHYALVYMVTKAKGDAHQRLARLCMDVQEFQLEVKHRKGEDNLLADAVSRLFHHDEIPVVLTSEQLRDDFEPLTQDEIDSLAHYNQDREWIVKTINQHRTEMKAEFGDAMNEKMQRMVNVTKTKVVSRMDTKDQSIEALKQVPKEEP